MLCESKRKGDTNTTRDDHASKSNDEWLSRLATIYGPTHHKLDGSQNHQSWTCIFTLWSLSRPRAMKNQTDILDDIFTSWRRSSKYLSNCIEPPLKPISAIILCFQQVDRLLYYLCYVWKIHSFKMKYCF